MKEATHRTRLARGERERIVLDAAARLYYARGVHEVGMDELITATGLGKATVYRLYPTKDQLVGAYLQRLSAEILSAIDRDVDRFADDPRAAALAVLDAIEADIARATFRGCAFNNASIEFEDPDHPARVQARRHRAELHRRLVEIARRIDADTGHSLGARLAVLIDGAYTSAAHLGPKGPAAEGIALARELVCAA